MSFFSRFTQKNAAGKEKPAKKAAGPAKSYRGVEIVTVPGQCCSAAEALSGRRFLDSESPLLPLKDCDRAHCNCRYEKFKDRRREVRRSADLGIRTASDLYRQSGQCRRKTGGRRKSDFEEK